MTQRDQFLIRTLADLPWIFLHARHYGDHVDKHAVHGYCARVGERTLWGYCEAKDSISPMALGAARALKLVEGDLERKVEFVVTNGGFVKYLKEHVPKWALHNVNGRNITPEAYDAWEYLFANKHRFSVTKLKGRSDLLSEMQKIVKHLEKMKSESQSATGRYRLISADETHGWPVS